MILILLFFVMKLRGSKPKIQTFDKISPSHIIRHPSKTRLRHPLRTGFLIKYPYPQSGALTIYDDIRPALRKGCLMQKKWFLKGAL